MGSAGSVQTPSEPGVWCQGTSCRITQRITALIIN